MLLIVASDNDPNAQRLIDQAFIYEVEHRLIDVSKDEKGPLYWQLGDRGLFWRGERIEPSAAYVRHDVFTPDRAQWSHDVTSNVVNFLLANPSVRMLNRQNALKSNNKVNNLVLARALGFATPETLVITGGIEDVRAVATGEDVIIKPMDGGAFAVTPDKLPSPQTAPAEALAPYHSSLVQDRLPGANYRVFVIGGEVFGFLVDSRALDYRTDDQTQVRTHAVPEAVAGLARALAQSLGFDYCALDFRADAQGQWVFLEINSFPMFVAFDDACENQLVNAQLRFLVGEGAIQD